MSGDGFIQYAAAALGVTIREARCMGHVVELVRAMQADETCRVGFQAWAAVRHREKLCSIVDARKQRLWSGLGEANEAREMPGVLAAHVERWSLLVDAWTSQSPHNEEIDDE